MNGGGALVVTRVTELPAEFERLVAESEREGFEFVRRLEREWQSGVNRFDQPGEVLLAAFVGGELAAIGGLNRDPYLADPGVGRVRHVFVAPGRRDAGVGGALVRAIAGHGMLHFARLRLRTANARSQPFYERLGFKRLVGDPTATHAYPE
jgi:GNAT superfamily N-acetyltransferase